MKWQTVWWIYKLKSINNVKIKDNKAHTWATAISSGMGMGTGGIPTTDNIPETTEKFGCPTDNIPDNRFFKKIQLLMYDKAWP